MRHLADQPARGFAWQPRIGVKGDDVANIGGRGRRRAVHRHETLCPSRRAAAGSIHAACRVCAPSPSIGLRLVPDPAAMQEEEARAAMRRSVPSLSRAIPSRRRRAVRRRFRSVRSRSRYSRKAARSEDRRRGSQVMNLKRSICSSIAPLASSAASARRRACEDRTKRHPAAPSQAEAMRRNQSSRHDS